MHEHFGALDQQSAGGRIADVAPHLLDGRLELVVVQWRHVEGAHLAAVSEETAREVQTEKARAAGDRPAHGR